MTEIERIEYNKKLIERYPFLLPRNRFTDKVPEDYDYSWTELDALSIGWRKSFGEMMCEDIKQALLEDDLLNNFRIDDIKEKFGYMHFYHHGGNKKVNDIIEAYAHASDNICMCCGKPDTGKTKGYWIYPICKKCWDDNEYNKGMDYEEHVHTEEEYTKMLNEMKFITFHPDGEETTRVVDISETVNKIRENWEKRNG